MGDGDIASPWRRLAGYAVDYIVLLLLNAYVVLPLVGMSTASRPGIVVAGGFVAAYVVLPQWLWGRTVGKWCAGTALVHQAERTRVSLPQAVLRWALPTGVTIAALLVTTTFSEVVGYGWRAVIYGALLFDPLRRGLHDRLARTVVVSLQRGRRPQAAETPAG